MNQTTKMNNRAVVTVLASIIFAGVACSHSTAAGIDFEGFGASNAPMAEGTPLSFATDQGVTVSFATIDSAGLSHTPFIAAVGGQRVAFQSVLSEDTPLNGDGTIYAAGGDYSLTDGLRQTHDYELTFSQAIADLSLDVYDFRGDGPHASANLGSDTLILRTFDGAGNALATDAYTLGMLRPIEGNVITLSVNASGIHSALVDFQSIEGGTAIDNVQFTVPVPEPSTLALFGLGSLVLLRVRRRTAE